MEDAVLKLRSSLKEKLVQIGIKPEGNLTLHTLKQGASLCTNLFLCDITV